MGVIHKLIGDKDGFDWAEVPVQSYDSLEGGKILGRELVGEQEGARYFAIRYFEVQPRERTTVDQHPYDHGVIILRGEAKALLDERTYEVKFGDVMYISPNQRHQFKNTGDIPFGFISVSPNKKLAK